MEATTKWVIDPTHSEVGFKVKHMMISTVKGHFESFNATVKSDSDDFQNAQIAVSIDVDSISTKNKDRDGHLKSDDFFNAGEFPQIVFKSKSFDGNQLVGDLTIRNTTKEVTLNVDYNGTAVDPYGNTKAGFEISGDISRKEYGLKWNVVTEAGSIVVSDKVTLVIDAQFVKQQ
ncbi:YceI family protein [Portibacter lacus]|uniref:Polyisoprenoid-binding protein n=1 Tax=Portibacter lacus TaxID=1099794 RepID=A0AA37SNN8_9BACT|nr:YceI family protein [Portibacter lacus]GLR17971.1 polyisoprenoid-binding protein [Portibacter lacus]